ncbi:MAG: hypothetical protein V7696_15550 [Halioglobus sp.]
MKGLTTSILAIVFWALSIGAVADPGKPRLFQDSPVLVPIVNGDDVTYQTVGAAWLKRSKNRIDGRIMTTVATAGIPYTVWWVVFNNPAGCTGPCGMPSLADGGAAADVAVFNASGAISGVDDMSAGGIINLDLSVIGREGTGRGSQSLSSEFPPFFHRVLNKNNALCAEIHLDINIHNIGNREDLDWDWVSELTTPAPPGNGESFAVFMPAPGCK